MTTSLKVMIAEPSVIIRSGLETLLKRLSDYRLQFVEIPTHESLLEALRIHKPDILFINPSWPGYFHLQEWKEEVGCPHMKCIALVYTVMDNQQLRVYDEQIHIFDSLEEIKQKLERLLAQELPTASEEGDSQILSIREKEIVVCVVKGMTNREIADALYLSTHTVITHRRNIARKLQIHSASGLTIYAIVNKLVELSDIQQ
ncbi:DNA-binding response regulator [Parabacteroides sp. 52]|uniref:response regulator transcription factor n=1 Tax=unclassified Parabacteroides TaxID=2649774 RepID=UPI0013D78BCA|nr:MULTISPECIES: response regulator transcription factor [unclassified Parabacteroides]MDH6535653.1 DNA-binding NarL/FixJ family response regulator [Parabacteroides sp. PM5-20]NDV56292.1 DNA-binding response regulator [Parabacteroides sp. 52]